MRNLITRQKAKITSNAPRGCQGGPPCETAGYSGNLRQQAGSIEAKIQSKAKRAWPPGTECDDAQSPARIKLRGAVMHVPQRANAHAKKSEMSAHFVSWPTSQGRAEGKNRCGAKLCQLIPSNRSSIGDRPWYPPRRSTSSAPRSWPVSWSQEPARSP